LITENQLEAAIAEMQGQRHPNADTCLKLASYYTIRNELYPKTEAKPMIEDRYSYAAPPVPQNSTIDYESDTEFGKAVYGKNVDDVLAKLDEIMTGVYVVEPSLYRRIMRDLAE